MTQAHVGYAMAILLVAYVIWRGYRERRQLFDSFALAVERGHFSVRESSSAARESGGEVLRLHGVADGRVFRFRAVRTDGGICNVYLEIEDLTVSRVGFRCFGLECADERKDRARLAVIFEKTWRRSYGAA